MRGYIEFVRGFNKTSKFSNNTKSFAQRMNVVFCKKKLHTEHAQN